MQWEYIVIAVLGIVSASLLMIITMKDVRRKPVSEDESLYNVVEDIWMRHSSEKPLLFKYRNKAVRMFVTAGHVKYARNCCLLELFVNGRSVATFIKCTDGLTNNDCYSCNTAPQVDKRELKIIICAADTAQHKLDTTSGKPLV